MTKTAEIRMSGRMTRMLAVGVVTLLVSSYSLDLAFPELPKLPAVALGLCKIAALLGAVLLFLSTHGQRAQAPDKLLDERERVERDRAYVTTHRAMVVTLILFSLYLGLGRKLGLWVPNIPDIEEMLTVFTLLSLALPGIILAFTDRAPDLEDAE